MKVELWKRIDELFRAAPAQPADQRAAGLADSHPESPPPRLPW